MVAPLVIYGIISAISIFGGALIAWQTSSAIEDVSQNIWIWIVILMIILFISYFIYKTIRK